MSNFASITCRSTFVFAVVILAWTNYISGVNSSSSCNSWDKAHEYNCPSGQSIYHVWGYHDNDKEDRIYCYSCRSNSRTASNCYHTGYVNAWDGAVATLCRPNYYIAGVKSYHDDGKEDRRFSYRCCRNTGQCIRNCYLDGPENSWDGHMNYNLGAGQVIVGAFSYHRDDKE